MKFDITDLLAEWDYQAGQVVARRFTGKDGLEKLQLRVDLGVLQMNAVGRPDGKRPMGQESWFEVHRKRLEAHLEENDGDDEGFKLDAEACSRIQQEAIQYHHRYICFFQLEDYAAVERDCDRNLQVFEFVAQYAQSDDLAWTILQFVPQLLMMRTRARGTAALKKKKFGAAIQAINEGLEDLEEFYHDNEREDLLESSGELHSLRHWLEDVRARRPLTPLEKLQRQLDEAIQTEDYEKAAKVRDEMRRLETPE